MSNLKKLASSLSRRGELAVPPNEMRSVALPVGIPLSSRKRQRRTEPPVARSATVMSAPRSFGSKGSNAKKSSRKAIRGLLSPAIVVVADGVPVHPGNDCNLTPGDAVPDPNVQVVTMRPDFEIRRSPGLENLPS